MPDRSASCIDTPRTATLPDLALFKRELGRIGAHTPVQIATVLGYNDTTIRRILGGDQTVSVDLFKALKRHLGLVKALRICNLADDEEIHSALDHEMQAA
jgi:hypothetical protein